MFQKEENIDRLMIWPGKNLMTSVHTFSLFKF